LVFNLGGAKMGSQRKIGDQWVEKGKVQQKKEIKSRGFQKKYLLTGCKSQT